MPLKGNNVIANVHCHKNWQTRVKCHLNQAGKKKSRRLKRATKSAAIAPRPTGGALRPVIRCMTFKYNTKQRLGRGFSLLELKEAGVSRKKAATIGISVDHRRRNVSLESSQENVARLKAYMGNLVVQKKGKGEAPAVAQLMGTVMPIVKKTTKPKSRAITDEEKKRNVFREMRIARADARMIGIRQKKADQAAAEEALKKK
eukprot:m.331155 g.331155  ORF g.331155 m.331155 type:complete len:202 (-) comp16659_c0_seq1:46-651(-)